MHTTPTNGRNTQRNFCPSPKMSIYGQNELEQKLHVVRVPARKVGARLFEQVPYKQSLLDWNVQKRLPRSCKKVLSSCYRVYRVDTSLTCIAPSIIATFCRYGKSTRLFTSLELYVELLCFINSNDNRNWSQTLLNSNSRSCRNSQTWRLSSFFVGLPVA